VLRRFLFGRQPGWASLGRGYWGLACRVTAHLRTGCGFSRAGTRAAIWRAGHAGSLAGTAAYGLLAMLDWPLALLGGVNRLRWSCKPVAGVATQPLDTFLMALGSLALTLLRASQKSYRARDRYRTLVGYSAAHCASDLADCRFYFAGHRSGRPLQWHSGNLSAVHHGPYCFCAARLDHPQLRGSGRPRHRTIRLCLFLRPQSAEYQG
jgi:hypothetical protein